ncbi:hypothetical protein LB465_06170 [Salegentibacter sp. LM13S]|uniref:hypothetical protein n=1 Tax=Salegentibacter lacus TaxID=2873599 RepID=UPI001CC9DCC9|nr:hypothetical protein [Salegentibacter lacus]MBZ9630361.1 hypothetical protein [Salegentibacter lacus]
MKLNTYIAIFLTLVFFGKFLLLDTKVLNSILGTDEIALVNTLCKKKIKKSVDTVNLSQKSSVLVINSEALCNAPFYIPKINLSEVEQINNFQDFSYLNPSVISTYFSKNYPPPKLLVA